MSSEQKKFIIFIIVIVIILAVLYLILYKQFGPTINIKLPNLKNNFNYNLSPKVVEKENLNILPAEEEVNYENKTIEEHTDVYDLAGNYPEFILRDKVKQVNVNAAVKNMVDLLINNFKEGTKEKIDNLQPELISQLDFDYGVDNLDNELISLHFDIFIYNAGAAHGFDSFETLNYDLIKDKKLKLSDVFRADTKYLEKLSQIGNEYFSQKFEKEYFHPEGVEPRNENWQNFTLTKENIIFYFADYEIAPYSEGTQELEISLVDLKDYLNEEYQPTAKDLSVSVGEIKTYEDVEYNFTFTYPANYLYEDDEMYMFLTQNPLVSIGVPLEEFKGTNLLEALFIVGASEEEDILEQCEQKQENEIILGTETIDAKTWQVFQRIDAAAGNIYDSILYRLKNDDICYELALLLHSGNISNYDPILGIKEFAREKILRKLKNILFTFEIGESWEHL